MNIFAGTSDRYADLCSIRLRNRFLYCIPECTAIHFNNGNDGNRIWYLTCIYTNATPLGGYTKQYTDIATGKFLGINYLIWIAILVAAITWFIFNMTRHGKYMYAIGGNPQAAEVAGVPVKKTLIIIYAKAAAMYGLAGFMLGAKSGGASVQT
ncbi:MAG: ABC transporter permease subunit [Blautia wexlerae]